MKQRLSKFFNEYFLKPEHIIEEGLGDGDQISLHKLKICVFVFFFKIYENLEFYSKI